MKIIDIIFIALLFLITQMLIVYSINKLDKKLEKINDKLFWNVSVTPLPDYTEEELEQVERLLQDL